MICKTKASRVPSWVEFSFGAYLCRSEPIPASLLADCLGVLPGGEGSGEGFVRPTLSLHKGDKSHPARGCIFSGRGVLLLCLACVSAATRRPGFVAAPSLSVQMKTPAKEPGASI